MQGYKDSRIQGYKDTRIHGYMYTRIRIQGYKNIKIFERIQKKKVVDKIFIYLGMRNL